MTDEQQPNLSDLTRFLFPEENFLRGDFKNYFLIKRFNFITNTNNFPDLANLFLDIDQAWLDAIIALAQIDDARWIVPASLTIFCIRELRLSGELLLTGCTTPGFSHLRSAIEAFAQAQKIMREPNLASIWLTRDDNRKEYDKHFTKTLKDNLFPDTSGFAQLHRIWKMLCDVGPHPNVTSLGIASSISESESDVNWRQDFFEARPEELTKNLLLLMMCSLDMFKVTYSSFYEKLSLNPLLLPSMNSHFGCLGQLKAKYGA